MISNETEGRFEDFLQIMNKSWCKWNRDPQRALSFSDLKSDYETFPFCRWNQEFSSLSAFAHSRKLLLHFLSLPSFAYSIRPMNRMITQTLLKKNWIAWTQSFSVIAFLQFPFFTSCHSYRQWSIRPSMPSLHQVTKKIYFSTAVN